MLPPPGVMTIMQVKHRVTLPHTKHSCVCPGGTDVTVGGTMVIVVGGFVGGRVMFASILQQIRLPGHNPYRGFIIPSPEMVTISLGSHSDISTQMQYGSPVVGGIGDAEVGKVIVGTVVGEVAGGVVGGTVGNVIEGVVGGRVGNVIVGIVTVVGVPVTFRG